MTKDPIPQSDNSVQSLALALGKAIISTVPVAGNLINEFIDKTNQKLIANGQIIFLEEIAKGRADLADHEKKAFIPIGYRYYRAAQEGTVNRNLHLLAKLIRKQIDDQELSYEKYVTLDNAIRDLSLEEMIVLSELCKQIGSNDTHGFDHAPGYRTISIDNYRSVDFTALETTILKEHDKKFTSKLSVHSTSSLLSGKGLVLPISEAVFSGGYTKYHPSNMVLELRDIVAETELEAPS